MVHTDRAGSFTEGARRRVAFVLHLTKDWESRLGGDLVFMNPPTFVTPTFNALTPDSQFDDLIEAQFD